MRKEDGGGSGLDVTDVDDECLMKTHAMRGGHIFVCNTTVCVTNANPRVEHPQGIPLDQLKFKRVLFGGFPCYSNGPLAPAFDRVMQVGGGNRGDVGEAGARDCGLWGIGGVEGRGMRVAWHVGWRGRSCSAGAGAWKYMPESNII